MSESGGSGSDSSLSNLVNKRKSGGSAHRGADEDGPRAKKLKGASLVGKTQKTPKIRLHVVARRGGAPEHDSREKILRDIIDGEGPGWEEAEEELKELLASQGECDDEVFDTARFKTEYDIAIESSKGEDIGSLKVLVLDLRETSIPSHHFFASYDYHSAEFAYAEDMQSFAELFTGGMFGACADRDLGSCVASLQPDVHATGTQCWQKDELAMSDAPHIHILDFVIKKKWRGRGVGSKVYSCLQRKIPELGDAKFMFARLGDLGGPPEGTSLKSEDFKAWAERVRGVRAFHRRAGFRRIGNSDFFARASDADHPSRLIEPEEDAKYVPNTGRGVLSREWQKAMA